MQIHRVSVLLLTPRPPLLVNSEQVGFEWKVQRSEFTRRGGAKSTFENPEVIFPEVLRVDPLGLIPQFIYGFDRLPQRP